MFTGFYAQGRLQRTIGFFIGMAFGFLLQKGGVTKYDVIIEQLLLTEFTVIKIMLSAVVTGMIGVYLLRSIGLVTLHPKSGSFGATVVGGLIFGLGFGILGYCPGTLAGAIGQGSLDGLLGGLVGILIGAGIFASLYPRLDAWVLKKGSYGEITLPQLLRVNPWIVIVPVALGIVGLLWWIEQSGL